MFAALSSCIRPYGRVGLILGVALALMGSSIEPAQAVPKRPRVVSKSYASPAVTKLFVHSDALEAGGCQSSSTGAGCVTFRVRRNERWARIRVEDQSGAPVLASYTQDRDGDGSYEGEDVFCGQMRKPLSITPGVPLEISIWAGPWAGASLTYSLLTPVYPWVFACPGVATSGTVTASFYR